MIAAGAKGDAILDVRIRTSLRRQRGPEFVLDLAIEAEPGITILFGASGAGKTTLLDCIAGLQRPEQGRIVTSGEVLFDSASGRNLPSSQRSVGYLLQSLALFPHLTVLQNVQYGLADLSKPEREKRSRELLDSFRISAFASRRPGEISGGERQRVALARTLVRRPRVLLLDEPLTAIDAVTKSQIVEDLREWNRQNRIPMLYVTHDRDEVLSLGERVVVVEAGRVIAQGSPLDVLQRPQSETVAHLAGFENILQCAVTYSHPDQGTMTCRIAESTIDLEVPLTRLKNAQLLRVGIRAGDILLANTSPQGLSARNILRGIIRSLERRDATVIARVECGAMLEVHLTPAAVTSLNLATGSAVWLVIKTYSCHLLQ